MSVEHVEILVEEPSMEAALRAFLPRALRGLSFEIYPYQCKQDLLLRLPERLRGYAAWLPPDWLILVVVDRDDDNCKELKASMQVMVTAAGLRMKPDLPGEYPQVVHRIAIEELEAWYFGDWHAVQQAFPRVSRSIPAKAKFRDPDAIKGGTWEAFEKVLQGSGYFQGGLRKIEAARRIGPHLDAARSTSQSFRCLCTSLERIAGS